MAHEHDYVSAGEGIMPCAVKRSKRCACVLCDGQRGAAGAPFVCYSTPASGLDLARRLVHDQPTLRGARRRQE